MDLKLDIKTIEKMDGSAEERYASHPYVNRDIFKDIYVDFVPCYDIQSYEELKSAVDRTLLHTEYVKANLKLEQGK